MNDSRRSTVIRKLSPMLASALATLLLAGVAVAAVGSNSSAGADASVATEASTTSATDGSTSTSNGSTSTTDGSTSTTDGSTSTTIGDDGTTSTTIGDDGTTSTTIHDDDDDDDDDDDGPTSTTMGDDGLVIEPGVYTFPLANGGTVTVTIEQQLIVDFTVDAGDGWSSSIEKAENDRLRVELTKGDAEIEIEIRTDGGVLEVEIDD